VNERIGVAQIVKEAVSQTLSHVCAGHETSDVKKLDRYRAASFYTCAIVGFTSVGKAQTSAGAFYLEVANGSLGIDCRESKRMSNATVAEEVSAVMHEMWAKVLLTGNFLHSISLRVLHAELRLYGPTFEVASVKLRPTLRHAFHGGGGAVRTCSMSSTCPTRAYRPDRSKDRVALLSVDEERTV
jgi:hypothetical protein